jgi:hypothetical protein
MSQPQPYVTLKQFVEQLKEYPPQARITCGDIRYYKVTFPHPRDQHFTRATVEEDWNYIDLNYGERRITPLANTTMAEAITRLEPLAQTHPNAAVDFNGYLFDHFDVAYRTNNVECWKTTLNSLEEKLTLDAFLKLLNDGNIISSRDIFDLATTRLDPKVSFIFHRVGETWLTDRQLTEQQYPKLSQQPRWTRLFRVESQLGEGVSRHLCYCLIPESQMQQHFGRGKDLIDSLLTSVAASPAIPAKSSEPETQTELRSTALPQPSNVH